MISNEAVEAAAKAMHDLHKYGPRSLEGYMHDARAALEAAAPYMQQEPSTESVWDEAANVLYMGNSIGRDHLKAMWERNPYRSQP